MTAPKSIHETIREIPPPPCDGCPGFEWCRDEKLACEVFSVYVNAGRFRSGAPRVPLEETYDRIFKQEDS